MNLAGVKARIALVLLQVHAFAHANHALALQAALCLGHCLFCRIQRLLRVGARLQGRFHTRHGAYARNIGVQRPLRFIACRSERNAAGYALHGLGRVPPLPCLT